MSRRVVRGHDRRRPEAGFSLVELLIAMTLGLILVSGTIAVFAGNKRSGELNTAMANLQENARFAIEEIAADVRMAGFQGCIDINKGDLNTAALTAPTTDLRQTATRGSVVQSDGDWSPAGPAGFTPATSGTGMAVPGTHALSLQFGGPATAGLSKQMDKNGAPSRNGALNLDQSAAQIGLADDDYAIVSNCDTGDLFRVSNIGANGLNVQHKKRGTTHNASGSLTLAYGDERTIGQTMVMKFHSNVYYVGDTGLTNASGDKVRALYRQSLPYDSNNPPIEMVQGVENLRLSFGVRNANGTLSYVRPDATSGYDPGHVEALRVGLLMTSWDRIAEAPDERTYVLAGQSIPASADDDALDAHPQDARMRLVFNTTIRVRNRRDPT